MTQRVFLVCYIMPFHKNVFNTHQMSLAICTLDTLICLFSVLPFFCPIINLCDKISFNETVQYTSSSSSISKVEVSQIQRNNSKCFYQTLFKLRYVLVRTIILTLAFRVTLTSLVLIYCLSQLSSQDTTKLYYSNTLQFGIKNMKKQSFISNFTINYSYKVHFLCYIQKLHQEGHSFPMEIHIFVVFYQQFKKKVKFFFNEILYLLISIPVDISNYCIFFLKH